MLIVFEGLDGVGKSTVVQGVISALNARLMRTPSPLLKEARRRCSDLPPEVGEALFDLGNMMASAEMREMDEQTVVCDRYLVSTVSRRLASENVDSPELLRALSSWTWPEHLLEPALSVHLCLQEDERKKRVRHRGEMTADEERLEVDSRYRASLLMAYSELCDITIDLTGLDEEQAVAWVMTCLRERLPALHEVAVDSAIEEDPTSREERERDWYCGA
tara:strand:+ start:739 stop:1395 length:657 start_codon:yes stop_codon:yes gene_type:complete